MRTALLHIFVIILQKAISAILMMYIILVKGLDALTIEIEAVNEDALEKLEAEGVTSIPNHQH